MRPSHESAVLEDLENIYMFVFLHNRPYKLYGISGVFKYINLATSSQMIHLADSEGEDTYKYRMIAAQLGDEWITDLTRDVNLCREIAKELGYEEREVQEVLN